mgnify:CR=1
MLVFGLLFIFVCGVAYVHILNNKSVQSGNPSNPYLVEDDGIYEDDTYRSHFSEEETRLSRFDDTQCFFFKQVLQAMSEE